MTSAAEYLSWAQGGFTVGDGSLLRSVGVGKLLAPADAWDDGDLLRYRLPELNGEDTYAQPVDLLDFVDLADASGADIAAFAARHDALWLCEQHELPVTHTAGGAAGDNWWCSTALYQVKDLSQEQRSRMSPRALPGGLCSSESLGVWRNLARTYRSALNVAAALKRGERGSVDDWSVLGMPAESAQNGPSWATSDEDLRRWYRLWLTDIVNRHVALSGVQLAFSWAPDGEPSITMRPKLLHGALVVQLALAIAGAPGVNTCHGCGRPYVPARRPAAGRRSYCPACSKAARWRDAQRARRARLKEGG